MGTEPLATAPPCPEVPSRMEQQQATGTPPMARVEPPGGWTGEPQAVTLNLWVLMVGWLNDYGEW